MNNFISSNAPRKRIGVRMATETTNVAEEISQEDVVQPQAEQPQEEVQSQETQVSLAEDTEVKTKEFNFKKLREEKERLEAELRDYRAKQEASEKEEELGEEDLVEGRHLKRLENLIIRKELEAVPEKLRGKFEDFDQVVTKENLEKLKDTEPELFYSIQSGDGTNADGLYAKGVAAYKTLKGLGYSPEEKNLMKQKDQAQSNHKKPLSAQAIKGSGALHEANAFANGLTPELKKQLQKEMAEAAKAR